MATQQIFQVHKTPKRHPRTIQFEIIDAIFRGALTKAEIARGAHMADCNLKKNLRKLEEQGYIVSVEADFRFGFAKKKGLVTRHYAVTERAKMWRLVMQRVEELAPR